MVDRYMVLAWLSVIVNILLAIYVYTTFFGTSNITHSHNESQPTSSFEIKKRAKDAPRYRIAIMQAIPSPGANKAVQGVIDLLEREASFIPEIKVFDANSSRSLMADQIEEVVERDFDLIAPLGSQAAQLAKEITRKRGKNIPVVFFGTGDPVKLGLVDTVERSGCNVTGVAVTGQGWTRQMIELLPLIYPSVSTVLIPYNPTELGGALESYKETFVEALDDIGIKHEEIRVYGVNEISQKVVPFIDESKDLILVLPDRTMLDGLAVVAKAAEQNKVPIYCAMNLDTANTFASMSFGYSEYDLGRCAGEYIIRILDNGESPGVIPVNPMHSEYQFMVNLDNAGKQGLTEKIDAQTLFLMEHTRIL